MELAVDDRSPYSVSFLLTLLGDLSFQAPTPKLANDAVLNGDYVL